MGKSKGKPRQMNFSDSLKYLSDMMDQKQVEYSKHFAQALSSMRVRLEALEDVIMEKNGETEASLNERVLLRVAKMQGFQEVDTPVQKGSVVRLKIKEEVIGSESPTTPMQDAFMAVGHNQINAAIDEKIIGATVGQTLDITLPDPQNAAVQRKITFIVMKVFKGDEVKDETQVQATPEEQTVDSQQSAV